MNKGKEKKVQDGGNQEEKKRYQVVLVADDVAGSLEKFDSETPIVVLGQNSACKKSQVPPSWITF
jgi:hypothetical protein